MKYIPSLDKQFMPMIIKLNDFKKQVQAESQKQRVVICIERNDKFNHIYEIDTYKDGTGHDLENYEIIERIIKTLLWLVGGFKVYIAGSPFLYEKIKNDYGIGGRREFDFQFLANAYDHPFFVDQVSYEQIPNLKQEKIIFDANLNGCRIGFDAGGSDRKVSAVVDGQVVYSEEVSWFPKTAVDPDYHYQGIMEAMKTAASHMPRVDAIGVSSAGIYVNNKIMVASLFLKVPKDLFDSRVKNMYIDIAKTFGNVPLVVANDGDVSALAGAMELKDNQILGIAMGTSEAAGYVDENGNLKGWLNELAFVPVDFNKASMIDEWSGDYGCGVKYFSQDSVIKLAKAGGIQFDEQLSLAQKLKYVQKLNEENNFVANEIFENIGIYLGYTIAYYAHFYQLKHVLLLGRVVSGKGGNTILDVASKVLRDEFPYLNHIKISMPDEMSRRVGQSIAAACLPKIG
ncbi:MAG: ROK family protein [Bacilli bacterium]